MLFLLERHLPTAASPLTVAKPCWSSWSPKLCQALDSPAAPGSKAPGLFSKNQRIRTPSQLLCGHFVPWRFKIAQIETLVSRYLGLKTQIPKSFGKARLFASRLYSSHHLEKVRSSDWKS